MFHASTTRKIAVTAEVNSHQRPTTRSMRASLIILPQLRQGLHADVKEA